MSATVNIETTALSEVKKNAQLTYPSFGMDDPLIDFNCTVLYISLVCFYLLKGKEGGKFRFKVRKKKKISLFSTKCREYWIH